MATAEAFFGGATYTGTGSNVDVPATARLLTITPTADIDATLPPASACARMAGGPVFCVINNATAASGFDVTVKDSNGDTVTTVTGKKAALLTLKSLAAEYGYWSALIFDITGDGT